jgi:hypothetical protein
LLRQSFRITFLSFANIDRHGSIAQLSSQNVSINLKKGGERPALAPESKS